MNAANSKACNINLFYTVYIFEFVYFYTERRQEQLREQEREIRRLQGVVLFRVLFKVLYC